MKRLNDMDDEGDDGKKVTKQTKLEFSKEALMYSTVAGDRKKVMKLLDVRDGRTFRTLKLTSLFNKLDIHITYMHKYSSSSYIVNHVLMNTAHSQK